MGGFWSCEQTCVVKLIGREAVINKLVYTATNPVQDHLVDQVHHWPGANGLGALLTGRPLRATRPLLDGHGVATLGDLVGVAAEPECRGRDRLRSIAAEQSHAGMARASSSQDSPPGRLPSGL
jgi:hypothetical protein